MVGPILTSFRRSCHMYPRLEVQSKSSGPSKNGEVGPGEEMGTDQINSRVNSACNIRSLFHSSRSLSGKK